MKRSQVSLGAGSVTMPAMEAALTTEFMTTSRGIRPGKYNANKKKKSKKTTKHRCLFEFRRIIQPETSTNVTNSIPGWCGIASLLHLGRVDDTGFQQIFIDLTAAKST